LINGRHRTVIRRKFRRKVEHGVPEINIAVVEVVSGDFAAIDRVELLKQDLLVGSSTHPLLNLVSDFNLFCLSEAMAFDWL
jgi:hypothetical protein